MTKRIRVIYRQPSSDVESTDRAQPRLFDLEEFMAIMPSAIERAWFSLEPPPPFVNVSGVAIVSINGPLMQRGGGWWWDGYEAIRARFEAALADKDIGAVVLKIDSPGGVCSGCFTAARAMRAAKDASGKPVLAFADEHAYSAAYAMASVADEIYLPREGGVGSVGVIGVLQDWTAFNTKLGIKVAVITSGAQKADGDPDVPLTEEVIARYQTRIDSLARSFAELVGESRGMSVDEVLKLEAACLYGSDAVNVGLANGVTTFEEVVMLAKSKARAASNNDESAQRRQEKTMNKKTIPSAATPSLSTVTPDSGPVGGGTEVTISGAELEDGVTVKFGDADATDVAFVDASTLTCKTPAGAEGAVDVLVTNPGGEEARLEGAFTYTADAADAAEDDDEDADALKRIFAALKVSSVEKALGAIAAGKSAITKLAVEQKRNEALERTKLIDDARASHKLTPYQEEQLAGKSLDFVKGFLELQSPNAILAAVDPSEPGRKTSQLTWNDKAWAELSPQEKHALHNENHELYVVMRDAANSSEKTKPADT